MKLKSLSFLALLLNLGSCKTVSEKVSTSSGIPGPVSAPSFSNNNFAADINSFSSSLNQTYATTNPKTDFAISPFSIYSVLQMGFWGTPPANQVAVDGVLQSMLPKSTNGSSEFDRSDLAKAFAGFSKELRTVEPSWSDGWGNEVHIANAIFLAQGRQLTPEYSTSSAHLLNSAPASLDLSAGNASQASSEINNWVKTNTNNMIDKLVTPELLQQSQPLHAVLLNAVVFNRRWSKDFKNVSAFKFTGDNNTETAVPGIKGPTKIKLLAVGEMSPNSIHPPKVVVAIPFDDAFTSYLLIEKTPSGLKDLGSYVEQIQDVQASNNYIKMPKLDIMLGNPVNMVSHLSNMGLKNMFKDGSLGSMLQGMPDLYFKFIVHNARLTLDQEGIRAAASTAGGAGTRSIDMEPNEKIEINKSFDFALVHQNAVLFTGHFGNNN